MSPIDGFLSEEEKTFEVYLKKEIGGKDQLFNISRNIYILPNVEINRKRFKVGGTPLDLELPLFEMEIDLEKKKAVVTIRGDDIPYRCRQDIEDILNVYF